MRIASLCGALLLTATFAFAGSSTEIPSGLPGMQAPLASGSGNTADHVRIAAIEHIAGNPDRAIVVVIIDPGFHINANPASLAYLIATTLNITNETPLRVIYPAPVLFKPKFSDDTLKVYEGTIQIAVEFPDGALARAGRLFGTLTAQACTVDICLPPSDLPLPDK